MKNTFLLGLFVIANLCYSQSKQVTIIGNMPQEHGGDYVSFSKPIGKYNTASFYTNSRDTAVIKNDKFIKNIDISGPGFIYVYEKPFNGFSTTRFFAEPGDTVILERQNKEIIFKGNNAIVSKIDSDPKIGPISYYGEVYHIFKDNNTADKIIAKLKEKEAAHFQYYNDLFLKKQISKSCLKYITRIMEHSIDNAAQNVALSDEFREEQKMLITKEGANEIIDYVNLKYKSYNAENLKSFYFLGLIRNNGYYLEKQSLKKNKKINRFWNQFDDIFKIKWENFGAIDYIESDEYKQAYIGYCLLQLIKGEDVETPAKKKDLILVYKAFAEKFPNSSYIIPLSESIMELPSDNSTTNTINTTNDIAKVELNIPLGNLALYGTTLESVSSTPFTKPNQSLVDALAEKFPEQDLFIDFWATWCPPCIKQFSHNNDLHSFLDTKNIKTLYISADKEEDKAKWEKYIQDYNLEGYHFLTNKAYQEKFINPLGNYLPMYFVYNSKTKKLTKLEGLPSEKEKFYTQITNLVPTK